MSQQGICFVFDNPNVLFLISKNKVVFIFWDEINVIDIDTYGFCQQFIMLSSVFQWKLQLKKKKEESVCMFLLSMWTWLSDFYDQWLMLKMITGPTRISNNINVFAKWNVLQMALEKSIFPAEVFDKIKLKVEKFCWKKAISMSDAE